MGTTKISVFEKRFAKLSLSELKDYARDKDKFYAVNAVKAAKNLLKKRMSK